MRSTDVVDDAPRSPDDHLGRAHLFVRCGFECVGHPTPRCAVMRRELAGD